MSLDDYCLNVHEGLETPSFVEQEITRLVTVNGNYNYYHYNCDQVNDAGNKFYFLPLLHWFFFL